MEFKGVSQDSCQVYIIDDRVHEEDVKYPLSGPRGDFVTSLLGSMSLLDKTRVACWKGQGPEVVEEDILKSDPKVIIGLGTEMMNQFVETSRKITDMSGSVHDISIKGRNFKYLVLMSPSYVLNRLEDSSVTLRFSQDLYKAFQIVSGEYKDVLKEKRVLFAHTYDEFAQIYETYFKDDKTLAYDIETNARPPLSADSEIIGFSIANKSTGVYMSLKSLDHEISEEDKKEVEDFLVNEIFEKEDRKLIIHNTMYERPYTLCCLNYEINYDKADDTLVMARLLRGAKEGAGLKYQAQKNLQYPDWETGLSNYISGFRDIVSRILFGPKKFSPIVEEILSKTSIFEVENTDAFKSLAVDDQTEFLSMTDKIRSALDDIYSPGEIIDLGEKISEKLVVVKDRGGIQDSTIPYNWIPDRVLCQYGAVDSLATYDLRDFYFEMMDRDSTDTVDLHKGYRNWLEHMYVAYIMERNGLYWNEELVSKDEEFLINQATNCLRTMLKSPLFTPFIYETCDWKYRPVILSDYLPNLAEMQGFKVEYDKETEKYTVKFNGKRCAKGRISEIKIPPEFQHQYNSFLYELFEEEVNSATSYEELRTIYNPSSSTQNDIPRKILINDTLQMGGRILKLHTLATSPEFESTVSQLSFVDQKFLKVAKLIGEPSKLKEMYKDQWAAKRRELFEGFCVMYRSLASQVKCPEINNILRECEPVDIETFDDGGIITIYDSLVLTGIDQDDPSTWSPEFEWMINFRLFKKSAKIISSYIRGSVGRQSVVVVDKESVTRGDHRVLRKREYDPQINSSEDYLMAAKWSPNTAETGRWRSAQHTIPWGSQVKKYYTSRFKGGTCLAPDYSQMEVRTLAAISKDENMLDLFRSGKDFHTETAKKIYRKDEVTTAERRFSKTATFSLLYGAMEESFAANYCKGDLDYAKMVYGGFFEAYPGVKKWVDERHQEVQRDHRVSLELSGRFIPILPEGEGRGALNSMLRKSQNYPIQAQSADLTGCVIFDIQKYLEENHMKSLIIMYVHDSIEIDVYPYEMLQLVDKMKFILNDSPMRRMGLPSKADVTLGKSLGHEIDMESIEYNEDFTEGVLSLKGYQDEIYETVENWKEAYKTVEIFDEEWKEEFVSMGELFILRKAYTPTLGTLRHKGTCKVRIKYYS